MRMNLYTFQELWTSALKKKNDKEFFGYYDGQIYDDVVMGHKIYISGKDINNNRHIIRDEKGRFTSERKLKCLRCRKTMTKEGHDPCIANLPGVKYACCGHGKTEGYILFKNGIVIRGKFKVEKK